MGQRKELDPQLRSRICGLYSIGWSPSKIHQKHPEVPYGTIRTTIQREHLRQNNKTMRRSGRPQQLTEEQKERLYELSTANPPMSYKDMLTEVNHAVQKRSLQRVLSEMRARKQNEMHKSKSISDSAPVCDRVPDSAPVSESVSVSGSDRADSTSDA